MKPWQILERAEAELRRCGWRQGAPGHGNEPKCVVGAIHHAGEELGAAWDTTFDCRLIVSTVVGNGVIQWNDTHGRKAREVREALLAAASLALSEEHAS